MGARGSVGLLSWEASLVPNLFPSSLGTARHGAREVPGLANPHLPVRGRAAGWHSQTWRKRRSLQALGSLRWRLFPGRIGCVSGIGPQHLRFQVTAEGLTRIQVGERELAHGGWTVFNAEPWFKDSGSGRVDTQPWREKSLTVLGPQQARVRHVRGDVTCLTDYTFAGKDVLISARVESNHADEPLNVVGFSGLEFAFDRPPSGLMMVQHISAFFGLGLRPARRTLRLVPSWLSRWVEC